MKKPAPVTLDLNVDLADFPPGFIQGVERILAAPVTDKIQVPADENIYIQIAGMVWNIALPEGHYFITDLVDFGIKSIHVRIAERPDDFPLHTYPFGAADWKLTKFGRSKVGHGWYLFGSWKPEALARTPSRLCPGKSIDLRRQAPVEKRLISSIPFPDLGKVTLNVWQWPSGKNVVMGVYDQESACPAPRQSPGPDQPNELRWSYPFSNPPKLEWDYDVFNWRSPATHALHGWSLERVKKPKDWLRPCWTEAIFVEKAEHGEVTDLRASLVSGPAGPAPLPEGMSWPCCPNCGEISLFSQSLDMRDVSFADLLPGTTAAIFVCNDCLDCGDWDNSARVVWLDAKISIVLQNRQRPASIRQCVQYYGPDMKNRRDMPKDLLNELERLDEQQDAPGLWFPPSYGTKAGGVPFYLQEDVIVYDRTGLVMEYIAQIGAPEHIAATGFGYLFYSTTTGETRLVFQDT